MRKTKGFKLDDVTLGILEGICAEEGLSYSEWLRLIIRAWRHLQVYDDSFKHQTSWSKAKIATKKVKLELSEQK